MTTSQAKTRALLPGIDAGVRCYVSRKQTSRKKASRRPKARALPQHIFVFDTETLTDRTQALTFGSWRILRRPDNAPPDSLEYVTMREGIFYDETAPADAIERLRAYVATNRADVAFDQGGDPIIALQSRTDFLNDVFYKVARRMRALIVGFNLPFDLSRLASSCGRARKSMRGGFAFTIWTYKDKNGVTVANPFRPRLTIKSLDSTKAFIKFARVLRDDWTDRIPEGSTSGRPVPGYAHPGNFLDLRTLSFSLTNAKMGLDGACKAFGVERKGDPGSHPGWTFDAAYIDYNRRDVRVSGLLLLAMLRDFALHPIDLSPTKVYSPASIAKATLSAMGITPPLTRWPNLDPADLGRVAGTYFGGRASAHVRKAVVPIVYCDFLSMYTTVKGLLREWELLTAKGCVVEECTDDVQALLTSIAHDKAAGLDACFDAARWPQFAFFADVALDGDVVPVRGHYDQDDSRQIGVNVASCDWPLPYAGPDLIGSCLLSGKSTPPRVLRAIRYVPVRGSEGAIVKLGSLRNVNLIGGERFDPGTHDLSLSVIEARVRARQDASLDHEVRARRNTGLKVLANSLYGIFAESNVVDTKDGESEEVTVHAFDGSFNTMIDKPEEPGAFSFPPIASLITSGARLMLALLERCVTDLGGTYANEDTDAMAIVASESGDPVPCLDQSTNIDSRNRDARIKRSRCTKGARGTRETGVVPKPIHALSWAQVDAIVARFGSLNPYDRTVVPDSVLKIEDINFHADGSQRQLHCLAISAKRYAIFELVDGEPRFHFDTPDTLPGKPKSQYSEHGLGHLMNPTDPDSDDRAWIEQTWDYIVRGTLGLETREPAWFDRVAMTRLPVSTPTAHAAFDALNAGCDYAESVKPFNFMIAPKPSSFRQATFDFPSDFDPKRFRLIGPFSADARNWTKGRYYNVYGGTLYAIRTEGGSSHALFNAPRVPVETFRSTIGAYPWHAEPKSAAADGSPCKENTVGLLARRVVRITRIDYIGKEANAIEDPIAGALSGSIGKEDATVRRYQRPDADPHDALRAAMRAVPTAYLVEHTRISKRQLNRIRNGLVRPREANLSAIKPGSPRWRSVSTPDRPFPGRSARRGTSRDDIRRRATGL